MSTPIIKKAGWMLVISLFLASCGPKLTVTTATSINIKEQITTSDAPLLLVHTWATWCQPCREEFPELVKVYAQFQSKGVELLLISADDPSELQTVRAFLEEHQSPVGSLIATQLDQTLIESISPNWGGALPASFFYADGKLLAEWEGMKSYEYYAEQIDLLLNQAKGVTP